MSQLSPTPPNQQWQQLQDQLLRNEQLYFEQLDQQAEQLDQKAEQLERCKTQVAELTKAIQELDADRSQRQEAFEAEQSQRRDAFEAERQQWQAIFQEAQQEQHNLNTTLAEQRQAISLGELQLRQAQEELATSLALLHQLEQWQQQLESSLQRQLHLLLKTVVLRSVDQLRWLLPTPALRRHKARIQRLLSR